MNRPIEIEKIRIRQQNSEMTYSIDRLVTVNKK